MMLTPIWFWLKPRLRQQTERVMRALKLLADGRLRVIVDRALPQCEAAETYRYLGGGRAAGKVGLAA